MGYNHIIGILNNAISSRYLLETMEPIEMITGEQLVLWPATTPETMPNNLVFEEYTPKTLASMPRKLTDTEKAVWYSHYLLWKYLIEYDRDSWIFEHDADVTRITKWPEIMPEYNLAFGKDYGSMVAYYINSDAAAQLVERVENVSICGQIDTFLYDHVTRHISSTPNLRVCRYNMDIPQLKHHGTTIQH